MPVNYDYPIPFQGKMAKTYLWQMENDARKLRRQLGDNDQLPGWVNTYLYTSHDRLQTAARYMDYAVAAKQAPQNLGAVFQPSGSSSFPGGAVLVLGAIALLAVYEFGYKTTRAR